MKTCTKCKETKLPEEFHKNKRNKDGLDSHCKSCEKKRYRLKADKKGVKKAIKPVINEHGKQCTRCKEFKPYEEFSKHPQNKTGKHPRCKSCRSEVRIKRRLERNGGKPLVSSLTKKGQEERKSLFKKGFKKCGECNEIKSINDFYASTSSDSADGLFNHCKDCNRKRSNKYREENRDEVNRKQRKHKKNNPGYNTKRGMAWAKEKRKTDPLFRFKINLRSRISQALKSKGYKKKSESFKLLRGSLDDVKHHMESQFTEGMTWENQGEWHIDHNIPLASATSEEELIKLCHYKNLQPLWGEDNLSKGDSMPILCVQYRIWKEIG